jgi:hypothetical protein
MERDLRKEGERSRRWVADHTAPQSDNRRNEKINSAPNASEAANKAAEARRVSSSLILPWFWSGLDECVFVRCETRFGFSRAGSRRSRAVRL